MSLGNHKLKKQQDNLHTYSLVKIQNTTTPKYNTTTPKSTITNAGEDVELWELSFTIGGGAKWYSHFGR